MVPIRRISVVTLGLAAAGAVAGGVCAAIVAALLIAENFGAATLARWDTVGVLASLGVAGAGLGSVALPALAWMLLRRIPLGRAVGGVALGALLGAGVGEWLAPFTPYARQPAGFLVGAAIGFLAAGLLLRVSTERGTRARSSDAISHV
ncbi:MAG TPA: hypothetical protein VJ867_07030 [Gemmatimonadaceae bacterium]|nr:hypothetical protein [Gemmatimonadaceae bacterium]